jgi:hypothetical protein
MMTEAVLLEPPPRDTFADERPVPVHEPQDKSLLRRVLQDRNALLDEIACGKKSDLLKVALVSFALTALGGLGLGAAHGPAQALAAAVKLPLINLGALLICLPTFYIFAALQGSRLGLDKILRMFAVGLGLRGAVIAGLAPLLIFVSSIGSPYGFILLAGGLAFGLAELGFMRTLDNGVRIYKERTKDPVGLALVRGWMLLYMLVAMQLTWSLRPVIGEPGSPFTLLTVQDEGNMIVFFFKHVASLAR